MALDKRIPELPRASDASNDMLIPVYDPTTDATYGVPLSLISPQQPDRPDQWATGISYLVGDIVSHNAGVGLQSWIATTNNSDSPPSPTNSNWILTSINGTGVWSAGVYNRAQTTVLSNYSGVWRIYVLTAVVPFLSTNIAAEYSSGFWQDIGGTALGLSAENVANKATTLASPDNIKYPTTLLLSNQLALKVDQSRLAYSVFGNPNAATGNGIDLTANDGQILRRRGTSLGFGNNGLNTLFFNASQGIDSEAVGGTIGIGTTNASVINIGRAGASTINLLGTVISWLATDSYVSDQLITLNRGGGANTAVGSGFEIEEAASITGFFKTTGSRDGFAFKAPAISSTAEFLFTSLTANRQYTLPNSNGTIALLGSNGQLFLNSTVEDTLQLKNSAQPNSLFLGVANGGFTSGNTGYISWGTSLIGSSPSIQFSTASLSISTSLLFYNGVTSIGGISSGASNGIGHSFRTRASNSGGGVNHTANESIVFEIGNANGTNGQFNPSSGTGVFTQVKINPTYATSGTHSGAVHGLFYDPTLTSLATGTTHYAIRTTSGQVLFANQVSETIQSGVKLEVRGTGLSGSTFGIAIKDSSNVNLYRFGDDGSLRLGNASSPANLGVGNRTAVSKTSAGARISVSGVDGGLVLSSSIILSGVPADTPCGLFIRNSLNITGASVASAAIYIDSPTITANTGTIYAIRSLSGSLWFTQGASTAASGLTHALLIDAGAHTNLASESIDFRFNGARAVSFTLNGTIARQAFAIFEAPTSIVGSVATTTLTHAYNVYIQDLPNAGANAAITNKWALGVQGNLRVEGTRVNMANLPTSSAGLAAGDLWKNGTVINIV